MRVFAGKSFNTRTAKSSSPSTLIPTNVISPVDCAIIDVVINEHIIIKEICVLFFIGFKECLE